MGSHKRRSCSIVVAFNMVQPDPAFHARAGAPSATCTIPMQGRSYAIQGCGAAGGMRTCEQPTTSLQAVTDLEQGVPFVVLVGCLVLLVVHARVAAPAGCGGPRCGGREWYARCLAGCGATASGRHSCPGCRSTRTERFEIPNSHKKKKKNLARFFGSLSAGYRLSLIFNSHACTSLSPSLGTPCPRPAPFELHGGSHIDRGGNHCGRHRRCWGWRRCA